MEFLSSLSDIYTDQKEFSSLISRAKDCQLNYSMKKIDEFNFLNDYIINEIMPDGAPEVLLDKRHKIKNVQKRV